ncbi:MAG: hypothetical protein HY711_10650, partial [Candidatus Melainabacteria bacterium]|nr:hypothetical protein [Candidatus Melainabacteria bacterium]
IELSPDADFVHDAKKQLAQLDSDFAHSETEEPEVKMNIMPPPGATNVHSDHLMRSGEAGPAETQRAKSDVKDNVNMFVQPPQEQGAQKNN